MSTKVIGVYLEAGRRLGHPISSLLSGLRVTEAQLRDPSERVDWADFCELSDRVEALAGPEEMERQGAAFGTSPLLNRLFSVPGLLTTPRMMFWSGHRWFGPAMFTVVRSTFEDLPDGLLRISLEIPEPYRDCASFFRFSAGVYRGAPRLLGQREAVVRTHISPRRAVFLIQPPPSTTLWARFKRAATMPFVAGASFEELCNQQQRLQEQAAQLALVNDLGERLARLTSLDAVADSVLQLVRTRFGATALSLTVRMRPEDPPPRPFFEWGEATRAGGTVFPLSSGVGELGSMTVWGLRPSRGGLDLAALLPWISLALANARSFALVARVQNDLEQQVEKRTLELKNTTEQLEEWVGRIAELDDQKTRFFANASHELRTPLTLVLAPLERLVARPDLADDVRSELRTALRSGYRLVKLINDLLDLATIEAGRMPLRRGTVNLSELLEDVVGLFRPQLSSVPARVEVAVEPGLIVTGDPDRLEQVMLNLVSNAVKHVNPGGAVRVRAKRRPDGGVEFTIENTGFGLDRSEEATLFDRFAQSGRSRGRGFGSSGLGLPVVRELVELHGGDVRVDNTQGEKVAFVVSLPGGEPVVEPMVSRELAAPSRPELMPYQVMAEREVGAAPEPPDNPDLPLLLIAEDHPQMRLSLRRALSSEYRVIEAEDGRRAFELAKANPPDLVLSDLMMPELGGLDLCRELRRIEATANIPFILLTARGDLDAKVSSFAEGVDDYVVKPFLIEEVRSRLRSQLRIRQLARQVALSEKLAAIGTLAAGVAHEIRNPLNGVINALAPLKELVGVDHTANELLQIAREGATRVEEISALLIKQVRAGEGRRVELNLSDNVALAVQLLAHKSASGPEVAMERREPLMVIADGTALNQAWINLLDNALFAARKRVRVAVVRTGDSAVVEIEDDGPGIAPQHLRRIFDPFFTTKDVGQGTGLGLSMVREIIQKHGGEISVQSRPGEGALFRVSLPLAEGGSVDVRH